MTFEKRNTIIEASICHHTNELCEKAWKNINSKIFKSPTAHQFLQLGGSRNPPAKKELNPAHMVICTGKIFSLNFFNKTSWKCFITSHYTHFVEFELNFTNLMETFLLLLLVISLAFRPQYGRFSSFFFCFESFLNY